MRIPAVLATTPVAGPQPGPPEVDAGAEYRALGMVGQGLVQASTVASEYQRAKDLQTARLESSRAEAQYQLSAVAAMNAIKETESDPDEFQKRWTAANAKITSELTRGLSPGGAQLFNSRLPQHQLTANKAAEQTYHNLYVSKSKATLDDATRDWAQIASMAPTTEKWADAVAKGEGVINAAGGVITPEEKATRLADFRQKAAYDRGYAEVTANPETAKIEPYRTMMSPEKYRELANHQTTMQKSELTRREKEETAARQAVKDARQERALELDQLVKNGNMDEALRKLEFYADSRIIDPEDYRRVRGEIDKGPQDKPSDAATLEKYTLDVHSAYPRTTESAIKGDPRLNREDKSKLLDVLYARTQAAKSEGDSELQRAHNQAEQTLRASLGIRPGVIVTALGDDPAGKLYFQALDDLTKRSRLFQKSYGGSEDPLKVVEEIAPKYNRALVDFSRNQVQQIQTTLQFPTRQALEQARQQGLPQAQYMNELRKFDRLDKLAPNTAPSMTGKPPDVTLPKYGGSEQRKEFGGR